MRAASFGLVLASPPFAARRPRRRIRRHPVLRRGDRERRYRQHLRRRVGVHGRRRRGHVRLQRRRLPRPVACRRRGAGADSIATSARAAARSQFAAEESGLEFDAVTGAYPLDIDSDGIMDLVLLRVGENRRSCAASAAAASSAPTRPGASTAATPGRRRSPPPGRRGADWPTLAIGNYIDRTRGDHALGLLHRQLAAPAQAERPGALRRAAAAARRATARSPCCSPTGTAPARRRCASPTTANITRAARSRCGMSNPASRRRSTPTPTAGSTCASGAWASPATTSTGDGYPEYFLTSMADNKLQTLAACRPTAAEAHLRRHRLRRAASPRTAPIPAATRAPAPPGTRSSRT